MDRRSFIKASGLTLAGTTGPCFRWPRWPPTRC